MIGQVTLVKVQSGSVDLVHSREGPILQFNCSCTDALPYCKGMCCGNRHVYNTILESGEEEKYASFLLHGFSHYYLAYDTDKKCVYQDKETGMCGIHGDKPSGCRSWHCSPGGVGEGIMVRDGGWFMVPLNRVKDI